MLIHQNEAEIKALSEGSGQALLDAVLLTTINHFGLPPVAFYGGYEPTQPLTSWSRSGWRIVHARENTLGTTAIPFLLNCLTWSRSCKELFFLDESMAFDAMWRIRAS